MNQRFGARDGRPCFSRAPLLHHYLGRDREEIEKFEGGMNVLSGEGWELVNYNAVPLTGSIATDKIKGYAYIAIFKRPNA